MTQDKIEKILLWATRISFYALVFAPLIFWTQYFFPFIFPKIVYARILIEFALVCYIVLAIKNSQFRPKLNFVYISLIVFALAVFITAIFGINFNYSFWGNYERMDGIFSWLHYWLAVVAAVGVFRTKKDWQILFGFSFLAALAVSFYGFMQKMGASWVFDSGAGRISSTIGNPGFLASYLLFNIVFAATIIADKARHMIWRAGASVLGVIFLTAFLLTNIRGAFVGLLAGFLIFSVLTYLWSESGKIKKNILIAFVSVVVLVGLGILFKDASFVQKSGFGRFFNIDFSDSTIQTRLISWRGALTGLKENPLLGVGPQKFDYVFNKNFDPEFYNLVGNETWWDRAHNMLLEPFVTMGILGGLAYLLVGFSVLYYVFRMRNNKENRMEAALLISFLFAYLIQNLFIFDSIVSYLMMVLFVAYVVSRSSGEGEGIFAKISTKLNNAWYKIFPSPKEKNWFSFFVIVLILMTPVFYYGNYKMLKHNKIILEILTPNGQTFARKIELLQEAGEYTDFDKKELTIRTADVARQYALSGTTGINSLDRGYRYLLSLMEQAIKENPDDVRLLVAYADAANLYAEILASVSSPDALPVLDKAEKVLLETLELGKRRQQVYFALANNKSIRGEEEEAIEVLEEAISFNDSNSTSYWFLANSYLRNGQFGLARDAVLRAIDLGYSFSNEVHLNQFVNVMVVLEDYEGLRKIYERALDNLRSPFILSKLAAVYAQLGETDSALQAANQVGRIEPSLRGQVDEFIEAVNSGETNFVEFIE